MKKILLVAPDFKPDFFSKDSEAVKLPSYSKIKGFMAPLHLATVAALTPDDIEVDVWDEIVQGRIDDSTDLKDYDIVGVTGYISDAVRAIAIAKIFRQRGIPVAIGGTGVSAAPQYYRSFFDILFLGEAELTWPQFIADWKAGAYQREYRQVIPPDLAISPLPRWDGIDMSAYRVGAVQTTRGCPFDCEFCDVIYIHGRRSRHKPIDKVLQEVSALECLGVRRILFCDDNFIGNPGYTKELLRKLVDLNSSFKTPMSFFTQVTINVAKDEELLDLLADANFGSLLIGIESPNKESLKETNKLQNYRTNLVEDCQKIQLYGMSVRAAMIVGFDHDDKDIFDQQFEFLQEACIAVPGINILKAPMGTKLWARLLKEGRVLADDKDFSSEDSTAPRVLGSRYMTNIIPKQMTREELFSNFLKLQERIRDWENFEKRVKGFVSGVTRPPKVLKDKQTQFAENQTNVVELARSAEDEKERNAIINILLYTRDNAPFLLRRVGGLIFQQYNEIAILQSIREAIHRQIELEKSLDIEEFIDKDSISISEDFKKSYRKIFPEIYNRVYLGLKNKIRTNEVLVEIFSDFIIRWGETFEQLEDYHKRFLNELADRSIAKMNSIYKYQSNLSTQNEKMLDNVNITKLADGILKAIEQKFWNLQ